MRVAVNVVSLYAAWFATVLLAANGSPYLAAAASLAAVALNVALAGDRARELLLVAQAAAVGSVVDTALLQSGFAAYASPGPIMGLAPVWLISMWMAFATSLNVSLGWLQQRLGVAALLGLIGGPAAYYAGARLGGMSFSEPIWTGLAVVGASWTFALPLLLLLARRNTAPTT